MFPAGSDATPLVIVIQTPSAPPLRVSGDEFVYSYKLSHDRYFSGGRHFVRLAHWESLFPSAAKYFVLTDFTVRQEVDGHLVGFLGITSGEAINEYVPLANNHIPAFGEITLKALKGQRIAKTLAKGVLILHVVPERHLYGAAGEA